MASIAPFPGLIPENIEDSLPQSPTRFIADKEPCLYACRVDYRSQTGMEKSFTSLIARIDPFSTEKGDLLIAVECLPQSVDKALTQLKESGLKEPSLKGFYEDSNFELERIISEARKETLYGFRNSELSLKIWRIRSKDTVDQIKDFFLGKECVLVDGVQSLKACRRLWEGFRGKAKENSEAFWPLVCLVNLYDFGVSLGSYPYLLPRHSGFNLNRFVFDLTAFFDVQTYPLECGQARWNLSRFEEDLRSSVPQRIAVGAAFHGEDQLFLFTLKEKVDRSLLLPPQIPPLLYNIPSVFVRHVLVERFFCSNTDSDPTLQSLKLAKEPAEAISLLKTGRYGACFFHPPPLKKDVLNLALSGERLPPGTLTLKPSLFPVVYERLETQLSHSKP